MDPKYIRTSDGPAPTSVGYRRASPVAKAWDTLFNKMQTGEWFEVMPYDRATARNYAYKWNSDHPNYNVKMSVRRHATKINYIIVIKIATGTR